MQIYVGNLPETFSDKDLRKLFEPHGTVKAATIVLDKKSGKSQCYGFVEMQVKSEARAATDALRGKELEGKPLRVRVLKPDDDFLQHAQSLHAGAQSGSKIPGKMFKGNVGTRASGAIRRGGQRGT